MPKIEQKDDGRLRVFTSHVPNGEHLKILHREIVAMKREQDILTF